MYMQNKVGIPWKKDPWLISRHLLENRCFTVVKTFQNKCLKKRKPDPAHFYAAPGLVRQVLLKTTCQYCEHQIKRNDCELFLGKFRFEMLKDIDMLLMFEKNIRTGITQQVKPSA